MIRLSHDASDASIDKDVQMLEFIGIVESEYVSNAGQGRCRIGKYER